MGPRYSTKRRCQRASPIPCDGAPGRQCGKAPLQGSGGRPERSPSFNSMASHCRPALLETSGTPWATDSATWSWTELFTRVRRGSGAGNLHSNPCRNNHCKMGGLETLIKTKLQAGNAFSDFTVKRTWRHAFYRRLILSMFWELIELEDPFYSSFVGFFPVWDIHFTEVLGWGKISWNLV